ncbi:Riboflavin transporter [Methylobacterium crusticola]|uniref:Riboflavin transporter n=1 Tax=Methylobacterium crusticola TaxID=1697972 RepID=A0ABQ4QQC7_9HYPH|nr:DMT family transporter [Methylobacterium crusticola]GJD47493.1 Riboflavin transporter [Methylobacterium crusticola]
MATLSPALPLSAPQLRPVLPALLGDQPLRGIVLVVVSTVFLSSSDAIAKYLTGSLSGVEIAWLRYAGFVAVMLAAALVRNAVRGGPSPFRSARPGLQVLRGVALLGSSLLFLAGLRGLPVAEATAIGFVSPIFVTALSIPVLGEKVGARRWLAALVGLAGVLVIVRPGTSAFQTAALLPVASALCWAGALVITRKINGYDAPQTTMTWSALVGFVLLCGIVPFVWATPSLEQVGIGAAIGLISTAGHWIVTIAYRHAPASTLVPFSYSQIVWAALLGFFAFNTVPDLYVGIGVMVIGASGLYTARRERLRRVPAPTGVLPAGGVR